MKKVAAILLAVTVIASSAAIFAGVGTAVDLLASFEKEYEMHLFKADVAETPGESIANAWEGTGSK